MSYVVSWIQLFIQIGAFDRFSRYILMLMRRAAMSPIRVLKEADHQYPDFLLCFPDWEFVYLNARKQHAHHPGLSRHVECSVQQDVFLL